jgi:hypothetical protein
MTLANFELFVGNRRPITVRIRRKGSSAFVSLSSAQQVRLEYRNADDVAVMAPIIADRNAVGSDWANGRVVFMVDSKGLTARAGTYSAVVTVIQDGTDRTYPLGTFDVKKRPLPLAFGDPIADLPVSYVAEYVSAAVNIGTVPITAGMPVARSGIGLVLATWDGIPADGVAVSSADPGVICLYVGKGAKVRREDWSYTSPSTSLPAGPSEAIYLGTAGQYVSSLPTAPTAKIMQVVGEVGSDGKTLTVTLDYLVTL